ncbi:hypothetical protein [Desulfuromonas sp. AOP6]|uniref:hypothetical protein n=1 Tax=Desulfuromonas sp. AOP6 TaxID=1566351 RepID=UPI00126CC9C4|nr:hypothetical protein [Desulfuromonas sp. AOP6]BCA80398.1 hypothetical protein AOP6_2185 [Desulfuromonas sp. AOP6]
MKRFRFTLTAICLVLLWLGWTDVSLFLRNRTPQSVSVADLIQNGPPREWLHVTGGYQNLLEGISTSGTLELEAFLIPLRLSPGAQPIDILVETRDPHIIQLLQDYYFKFDSTAEQQAYQEAHAGDFLGRRDITGMLVGGLVASGNKDKLLKLAQEEGLDISENIIFLSEGKEPARIRGFFFLGLGLLGLLKVGSMWRNTGKDAAPETENPL